MCLQGKKCIAYLIFKLHFDVYKHTNFFKKKKQPTSVLKGLCIFSKVNLLRQSNIMVVKLIKNFN